MKRLLHEIFWASLAIVAVCGSIGIGYWCGYSHADSTYPKVVEQHEMCYDTDKYEAWVARKDGFMRCFMEYKQYPHRVRASHID